MNETKRAMVIWSLGAVLFSLIGVSIALTSDGRWYQIVSTIVLLMAGAAFAARAVISLRADRP